MSSKNIDRNNQQFTNINNQQFTDAFDSRIFNTNTTHPLIPSSQEYLYYKKYVSIHSEDRDILKYPSASEFSIQLPEDLYNVLSLKLYDWSFPCNYDVFTNDFKNKNLTFIINEPYNPNINNVDNLLIQKVYECLFLNQTHEYLVTVQTGFYNPIQMATELTNRFNFVVTLFIRNYFNTMINNSTLDAETIAEYKEALELFNDNDPAGYNNFIISYNAVKGVIWFGNICDGFTLTPETQLKYAVLNNGLDCFSTIPNNVSIYDINIPSKTSLPNYSTNSGLADFIGLQRINTKALNSNTSVTADGASGLGIYNGLTVPRFYFGDWKAGDNGYWLLPNLDYPGSVVSWIQCNSKINLMGQSYIYMEIENQNCIDETEPFVVNQYSLTTNAGNSVVNSAFAKISIPTTPISQWFDKDSGPYKFYYPPAERISKLKLKFRYHNGVPVNFGLFGFTFVLEFTLQLPQILRTSNTISSRN